MITNTLITHEELPDEDGGKLGEGEEAEVEEHVACEVLHIQGARDVEIVVHNPDHGHVKQNPGDKIHLLSESKPGGQGVSFLKIEVFINISLIFKSNFSSGEHFSERAQYYHVIKNLSPKALSNYSVVTELFIQVLNQLQFVDFPSM